MVVFYGWEVAVYWSFVRICECLTQVMILVLMEMVASIFLLSEVVHSKSVSCITFVVQAVECGLLGTTCWLRLE